MRGLLEPAVTRTCLTCDIEFEVMGAARCPRCRKLVTHIETDESTELVIRRRDVAPKGPRVPLLVGGTVLSMVLGFSLAWAADAWLAARQSPEGGAVKVSARVPSVR